MADRLVVDDVVTIESSGTFRRTLKCSRIPLELDADEPLDEGDAAVPNRDQDWSLDDFTLVRSAAPLLAEHDADAQFEVALETLLDWLDGELAQ